MRSSNRIVLVTLVVVSAFSARAAEIAGFDTEQQFGYDFERSEVDFKNDTAHFYGHVRVTQGPNSIQAEQAVARAFRSENKQWEFQESVLVRTADARLSADSATAAFSDNVLVATRVEGAPAEFERIGTSSDELVRGRARVIEYDVAADTVTLTGNVWFGYGKDEVEAETVTYSLRDERVFFNSGEAGRVRGVIRPRANDRASAPNSAAGSESSGNEGEA